MKTTLKSLMLFAMTMLLGMTSCSSEDLPVIVEDDPGGSEFIPTTLLDGSAYLADDIDKDLRQAFTWAVSKVLDAPTKDMDILVVNKLTDVSADVVKNAYEKFSFIAVVNPKADELKAYSEANDWININTENLNESVFIYCFNRGHRNYYVEKPQQSEDSDPLLDYINRDQSYYVFISSMLNDIMSYSVGGADEGGDNSNLEDFAGHYHNQVSKNFTVNQTFREILLSDPDVLRGSFSMTSCFDIYMAHVYEGEPGAGDYYAVKMTSSIASADLWKGKGWNRHGGVYVRYCGAYCTSFITEAHLISGDDWDEDTTDKLQFTAGGFPSPSTTVGQTTYQDTNSFSLTMSQTVSGGAAQGKGAHVEGQLGFSEGWTWSQSESRSISDVDVVNETKNGNWARWRLAFNNLPTFDWDQDYGFDVKNNQAARGTMDIHASWLWYDKTGKDDEDREPYTLCAWLQGNYEIQSFITTKADLDATRFQGQSTFRFQLPKMVNTKAGILKVKNDMADGMTISNVKVTNADTGEVYTEFPNTVPNGGEQSLGCYSTHNNYMVTFKAKKDGEDAKVYKYTLNPAVVVTHKETTTLYAASDFSVDE